ncbi:MAG: hypothetical protein QNJ57_07050 [Flavobacteriaceae bacterium]|nr:hypothetical protein [Flavobacteriaceae bacterium]
MKFKEDSKKIKSFITEYYWIATIPFLIWGLMEAMAKDQIIDGNKAETFGKVYGSRPINKKYSKRNYQYEFYYNGIKYTGNSSAYISKNVQNGNFYKVEFSYKNPKHSRMIFELEYVQKIMTDTEGKVIDTVYVSRKEEFRNEIKSLIDK